MVRHVASRAAVAVELVEAPRYSHDTAEQRDWMTAVVDGEIGQDEAQHVVDAAVDGYQPAIHIGLTERHLRVQDQPPDGAAIIEGEPRGRARVRRAGVGSEASVGPANP